MQKRFFILFLSIFICSFSYTQQNNLQDDFSSIIRHSVGDLNNDSLIDQAIITMDTIHATRPMRLQILFAQPNGEFDLFYSSTEIIEAMYPAELNGEHNGSQIPAVEIEDGKLILDFHIDGNSRYIFRFNKDHFELIHFTYVNWDGKHITEVEFDLLKGEYSKQKEILNSKEIILQIEEEVLIRPLPQLEGFKPFMHDLY